MGGNGAYLELSGLGNKAGFYVVEIPPAVRSIRKKHMYEEMYYAVEAEGSTEIWRDGTLKKSSSSNGRRAACSRRRSTPGIVW